MQIYVYVCVYTCAVWMYVCKPMCQLGRELDTVNTFTAKALFCLPGPNLTDIIHKANQFKKPDCLEIKYQANDLTKIYLFCFALELHLSMLLDLHSGFTPGSAQWIIQDARD